MALAKVCPPGSRAVDSAEECEAAAAAIGLEDASTDTRGVFQNLYHRNAQPSSATKLLNACLSVGVGLLPRFLLTFVSGR